MPAKISLTGKRFARLFVVKEVEPRFYGAHRKTCYECLCDCGKITHVVAMTLQNGRTTSCGCYSADLNRKRIKHGFARKGNLAKIYVLWTKMKARCNISSSPHWKNYGGRGICVCERWNKFENFFADMGYRPPGHSLGRINNDGPYDPSNCRWETAKQQGRNTRVNRIFTVNGITACVAELSDHFGISPGTAMARISRGWTPHEAFITPCVSKI